MSTSTPNGVVSSTSPRNLKILMLHGFTQSGPLFHAKTRALEKALHKAFPPNSTSAPAHNSKTHRPLPAGTLPSFPGGIQLIYPSGPRRLRPADIPGFSSTFATSSSAIYNTSSSPPNSGTPTPSSMISDTEADQEADALGWWQRNNTTGEYTGLEDFFTTIASTIRAHGGIDGVLGFSQGGAAAAMVASLLEPAREEAFRAVKPNGGIPYPECFRSLTAQSADGPTQGPARFFVSYSGFRPPPGWAAGAYDAFYSPPIATPSLHYIGSLDSVVEESKCLALAHACDDAGRRVVYHPGGHFVPISKEWVSVLVGFIRDICGEVEGKGEEEAKKGGDLADDEFPF